MIVMPSIGVALKQLRANKLRSLLSLIGILIAVGSVTGVVSLGDGLQAYIYEEFEQMGGYSVLWTWGPDSHTRNEQGKWVRRNYDEYLTEEDVEAIKAETDKVEFVTPNVGYNGTANTWLNRRGVSLDGYRLESSGPEYGKIFNWKVKLGRFINQSDIVNKAKVIVLGSEVAARLFGDEYPIEQEIKVGRMRYTVVGVMDDKDFFDNNYNQRSVAPYSTVQTRINGNDRIGWMFVKATSPEHTPEVVAAIKRVYKRLHKHGEDFNIRTMEQEMQQISRVILIMKAVAGGIAGISLLVGGIGIMNIMLVSVTERTREIGVRKALGAKRGAILLQFIVEAIVLCMIGGALGILLGIGFGAGMAALITKLTSITFISVMSTKMMIFAVSFSLFVGVTFGSYPAWRASRLDPVEALRQE